MNEKRESYLRELMSIRENLGFHKTKDLRLLCIVIDVFDIMPIEDVSDAMELVENCWIKDDNPFDMGDYAYGISTYMKISNKSFNELKDMNTSDLLNEVFEYIG